ncbi:MAG TPA: glycosyltransferase family 1 protein, partial [Candidatus Moranbacteria bacterium]|nr:glycosyltransferase family 1 protein [Candidatus Moranbacteria bacterium]
EPVVIRSGLDLRFFQEMTPGEERVLKRFGIDKKFILFLGTIEPSKNITRLLQAFAKFKRSRLAKWNKEGRPKKKFDYQLVLAGKKGWLAKEYLQIIKDFGLKKDVIFTGYVIGDELLPLFKKSEFFTLPSLYEGFGTTLLEAFATGTPAIVSDISSLRELAGDSAYYVNPIDIDDIAKAFGEFANDEKLRQKYSEKGLLRARKYDWDKVAESTLNLYKAVAGK